MQLTPLPAPHQPLRCILLPLHRHQLPSIIPPLYAAEEARALFLYCVRDLLSAEAGDLYKRFSRGVSRSCFTWRGSNSNTSCSSGLNCRCSWKPSASTALNASSCTILGSVSTTSTSPCRSLILVCCTLPSCTTAKQS